MTHRDRQILCGLFLSKFDDKALAYLGFRNFTESFNALGYGLNARPASIKNYRDELDPYFPNKRKGWHNRPLRKHCRHILNTYKDDSLNTLGQIIQSFIIPSEEIAGLSAIDQILRRGSAGPDSAFAKRLITGKAAEHYFLQTWKKIDAFAGMSLTDTTGWGCGFDFKLSHPDANQFHAVEIKGLREVRGQIRMTELEHEMAEALRKNYSLVVVRNFAESPCHTIITDPLHTSIPFNKITRKEIRVSWTAKIE